MSKVTLYYTIMSPPSRTILTVAAAIGLELEKKNIDLFKGEHLTPEYLKVIHEETEKSLPNVNLSINSADQSTTYSSCYC